jgi:Transposase
VEEPREPDTAPAGKARRHRTGKPAALRAYLLKEQLRQIYRLGPGAAIRLLEEWLEWARRCRLRPFVKLARTVSEQWEGIVAAIRHGLSNARVEAINTQIRLIARRAFGVSLPRGADLASDAQPRRSLSRPSRAHTVTHGNVRRVQKEQER